MIRAGNFDGHLDSYRACSSQRPTVSGINPSQTRVPGATAEGTAPIQASRAEALTTVHVAVMLADEVGGIFLLDRPWNHSPTRAGQ